MLSPPCSLRLTAPTWLGRVAVRPSRKPKGRGGRRRAGRSPTLDALAVEVAHFGIPGIAGTGSFMTEPEPSPRQKKASSVRPRMELLRVKSKPGVTAASTSGIVARIAQAKVHAQRIAERLRKSMPPPPGYVEPSEDSSDGEEFLQWFYETFPDTTYSQRRAVADATANGGHGKRRRRRRRKFRRGQKRVSKDTTAGNDAANSGPVEGDMKAVDDVLPNRRPAHPEPPTPLTPQVLSAAFLSTSTTKHSKDTFLGGDFPAQSTSDMMVPGVAPTVEPTSQGDSDDGAHVIARKPYNAFDELQHSVSLTQRLQPRRSRGRANRRSSVGDGTSAPASPRFGSTMALGTPSMAASASASMLQRGDAGRGELSLPAIDRRQRRSGNAARRHASSTSDLPATFGRHAKPSPMRGSLGEAPSGLMGGDSYVLGEASLSLPSADERELARLRMDLQQAMLADLCRKVTATLSKKERKALVKMLRRHEKKERGLSVEAQLKPGGQGRQPRQSKHITSGAGGSHSVQEDEASHRRRVEPVWSQSLTLLQPVFPEASADFSQTLPLTRSEAARARARYDADW